VAKESKKSDDKEKKLLSFLARTKEGKYAPIDDDSLIYSRIVEETEVIESEEDEFYYNIS
jgi:hypothetical protein